MIEQFLAPLLRPLLPPYLNGRLPAPQRLLVAAWLRSSPAARTELANLAALKNALQRVDAPRAHAPLLLQIQSRIRQTRPAPALQRTAWGLGMGLALLLALLVVVAAPPGNVLAWSVVGQEPAAFRIYRASESGGDAEFVLVEERPAEDGAVGYRFVDLWVAPGRAYLYRVEAVNQEGAVITSEVMPSSSLAVLPGQTALVLSLGVCVYGLSVYRTSRRRASLVPGYLSL